jgi:threonine synthase
LKADPTSASTLTHLQCSRTTCAITLNYSPAKNLCPECRSPLLARYDLAVAGRTLNLGALAQRVRSMWRYAEVLPTAAPVSLGEGLTPLLPARRYGARLGLTNLFIKDEGLNPTGSFKARG